jgi:hypothetical protein
LDTGEETMTAPTDIHGAWRLVQWEVTVDGGTSSYPMGEDARGQIIYSPDGHMSAILCSAERKPFDALQFHQGTADERDRAALTYVSYAGTWDLLEDVVTHHVDFALFPNWIGTDLIRTVAWEGADLVLTGAPETSGSGKIVVNRLVWTRGAHQ